MKFKTLLLLTVLVSLIGSAIACSGEEQQELPLPTEKVVRVLTDMHIAESALQSLSGERKDSVGQIYYEQIYTLHGVSEEQFRQTIDILEKDPALLQQVYQVVMDTLSRREAELN